MISAPVTGVRRSRSVVARERRHPRVQVHRAGLGEVAGEQPEQLVEVGAEDAVRRLLDAEVLERRDAESAAAMRRAAARMQLLVDAAARRRSRRRRRLASSASTGSAPFVCSARKSVSARPSWTIVRRERGQAPGVGARADAEVEVGQLGGLGAHRVDARSSRAPGPWRSPSASRGRAGSSATATGSCRRRPRPRRARSRRACGRRRGGRRPSPRPSSPARARWSGSAAPSARSRAPL